MFCRRWGQILALSLVLAAGPALAAPLKIASFQADITPPLGSPLCDGLVEPAKKVVDPLSARGIVLLGAGEPIVLCALDWVGVGNAGYDAWREQLARAAGTSPQRVALHSLHQHDAPGCDFDAETLLAEHGLSGAMFNPVFARSAISHTATALAEAIRQPHAVTHLGLGTAKVEHVASNRRVMGPDGKVKAVRYSATKSAEVRAAPEGTIDPLVRSVSFWDGETPLVSMTYYTTHPQSYYGMGDVSYDFVGMARTMRARELPQVAHVHFNGASGNVTAGKYNDGQKPNRPALAGRLADGMRRAWQAMHKVPIQAEQIEWRSRYVLLPMSPRLNDQPALLKDLGNAKLRLGLRIRSARDLAWAHRTQAGHEIELTCLKLGDAYLLHMPGELFVEYQLAAQQMRPSSFVGMAAYGDYGPGYIGTKISYSQGGYETGPVSRVAPEVEDVLMPAMRELLR
ncbi:MAG TPA: hypothetical protein VIK18_07735 [Pirellulales bacterium]